MGYTYRDLTETFKIPLSFSTDEDVISPKEHVLGNSQSGPRATASSDHFLLQKETETDEGRKIKS